LAARDARHERLLDACRKAVIAGSGAVVTIGVNVPGADKNRPGLGRLIDSAAAALHGAGFEPATVCEGADLLGPYRVLLIARPPHQVKSRAVLIEETLPGGRVLDLDVLAPDGTPVDRKAVGREPRPCYVCDEPARECILLGRHSAAELIAAVDAQIALARAG
jgi:holo-ACP synthase CitX